MNIKCRKFKGFQNAMQNTYQVKLFFEESKICHFCQHWCSIQCIIEEINEALACVCFHPDVPSMPPSPPILLLRVIDCYLFRYQG